MAPCQPWITTDEARDLCSCPDEVTEAALLAAIDLASEILYDLTSRKYPGVCTDVVRPCRRALSIGPAWPLLAASGWSGWESWWRWDRSWGVCSCNLGRDCGCGFLSELRLPGYPVVEVTEVLIDGVAFTDWRLDDSSFLVRLDGDHWPSCQNIGAEATEPDTWQVTYEWGREPTNGGAYAAAVYACEIAKGCSGLECQLPKRVQTITRQGMSATFLDPGDFTMKGLTGITLVDTWIAADRGGKSPRRGPAQIASPDIGRPVRRTGTTSGS